MISLAITLLGLGMQERPIADLGPQWSYVEEGQWTWFTETDGILALLPRGDQEPQAVRVRWEELESDIGIRSREMTYQLDCQNARARLVHIVAYAQPNLNGLIGAWSVPHREWMEMSAGSNLALLAERYC